MSPVLTVPVLLDGAADEVTGFTIAAGVVDARGSFDVMVLTTSAEDKIVGGEDNADVTGAAMDE